MILMTTAQRTVLNTWTAVTGNAPGSTNLTAHTAFYGTTAASAADFMSAVNSYITSLGVTEASFGATLLTNLGLSTAFTADEATAFVAGYKGDYAAAAVDAAKAISTYTGTIAAITAAKTVLNTQLDAAYTYSIVAANTAVITGASAVTKANEVVVSTFTLTTSADSGTAFTGGAGGDTYNAVIGTDGLVANGTTFNPGDNLNGGAGADTLALSISGTNLAAQTTSAVTLANIETVAISNFETSTFNSTIDLSIATGVTTIAQTSSSATGDTFFTGVQAIVAARMENGAGDLGITYAATVVVGTADTQTLALSGVTAGQFSGTVGIETLAITSAGSARNVLDGVTDNSALKTITVAGAKALTLGTVGDAVTSLDASANTGGLTATLSANTTTTVVKGSAGNDAITAGINLTTGSVDAGDGTGDTLVTTANAVIAVAADGAKFTNFETLSIRESADTGANRAQDMSLISGITTINATAVDSTTGAAFTSTHTFTNLAATTNTINITGLTSAEAIAGNLDLTLSTVATRQANTAADAMTLNLGTATVGSGTTGVTATGGGLIADILLNVSLVNEESITINSLSAANHITTLTNTAATSLTLTGSKALSIGTMTSAVVTTINASAMTAAFVMTTNSGAVASTITGGSGNDTLIGGSAADNIVGGAGNDAITGAAGADNLDGGAGDDTFNVTTVTDFTTGVETVVGGSGNDTLSIAEAGVTTTITAANLGAISGIETLSINSTSAAASVTLTDAVYTANGQSLKIVDADLTTGGGTLTVSGSALTGTNTIAVTANTATGINDTLTGGAGNDTFTFSTAFGLESTDTVVGGAGTDTISLTATAAVGANLTGVRTVENITTTGAGGNITITVGASTIATTGTLTVDAASSTTSANTLNYDGSLAATTTMVQNVTGSAGADTIIGGSGKDILSGGDGADTITGGVGVDNLSGGAGGDTFQVNAAAEFIGLATVETVSGGSGTDILSFADVAITATAADLAGMSSIERLTFGAITNLVNVTLTDAVYTSNGNTALTINALVATTGVVTVSAAALTAANSITLNMSATTNSGANVINFGAGNDTISIDMDVMNNVGTIAGGAGTDTLTFSANTGGAVTAVATITGFETVSFATAGIAGVYNLTVNEANVAIGITQTVNASNLTGTLRWIGTAETNGQFSITTGSGNDTLTGGSGADTLNGGTGVDSITGGLGADVMTGGGGADRFVYVGGGFETGNVSPSIVYYGGVVVAGGSVSTAGFDKITDFSSDDRIDTEVGGAANLATNGTGLVWTALAGFLLGTYDSTAATFIFSTTGTDSLYVYDVDGLTTTSDLRAIVLVGYVDAGTVDTGTTGLVGVG